MLHVGIIDSRNDLQVVFNVLLFIPSVIKECLVLEGDNTGTNMISISRNLCT